MIGANIKKLRQKHGMTQKALADKLFVSAQAVSRWENNEVEPSVNTIMELAKIFGVTADEILGLDSQENSQQESSDKHKSQNQTAEAEFNDPKNSRQFLAVCEKCNQPIYESDKIIRKDGAVWCSDCYQKHQKRERENMLESAKKRRMFSFIFGPLASIIGLIFTFTFWSVMTPELKAISLSSSILLFTFISCCILNNNFVGELFLRIATFSVKLPGLIFTFDLDGCLWFIGMKILFALIGVVLGIMMFLLALTIGEIISLFVYPYAIIMNYKHPENTYF